jgi:hypothetical protein
MPKRKKCLCDSSALLLIFKVTEFDAAFRIGAGLAIFERAKFATFVNLPFGHCDITSWRPTSQR